MSRSLEFYPRMRLASLSAGVMLVLFSVLALLSLDMGLVRALTIFTIGLDCCRVLIPAAKVITGPLFEKPDFN